MMEMLEKINTAFAASHGGGGVSVLQNAHAPPASDALAGHAEKQQTETQNLEWLREEVGGNGFLDDIRGQKRKHFKTTRKQRRHLLREFEKRGVPQKSIANGHIRQKYAKRKARKENEPHYLPE